MNPGFLSNLESLQGSFIAMLIVYRVAVNLIPSGLYLAKI